MTGALQEESFEQMSFAATGTESGAGLRQVASERLAEHRRRRARAGSTQRMLAEAVEPVVRNRAGASRVREAVAARYRDSETYREFLAKEAGRALQQAQAEAEVAARKAEAFAEAQFQLLEELEQSDQPEAGPHGLGLAGHEAQVRDTLAHAVAGIAVGATDLIEQPPTVADFSAELAVRFFEDLSANRLPIESARRVSNAIEADMQEVSALDEEIAFRHAPEFDPYVAEPVSVTGNLIEFPRQLVAARKARARLAEGPLREESAPQPQLRIFEVEPEQISAEPAEVAGAPEWQTILLDASPRSEVAAPADTEIYSAHQPLTAPLELRLMASAVDGCCIAAAVLGFVAATAELAGSRLRGLPLSLAGADLAIVAGILFVMFQLLFFTFGEATPGMRYARIGLCTFADSNPTRAALRGRVLAMFLAACPLGLGLAWAWMDEDGLGWHDRISKMYQRPY